MSKRINTDLGVNVSLVDTPDVKTVRVGDVGNIVGKSSLEVLSDALGQFNPKIQELTKESLKTQAAENSILGANKVNNMTLEEARKAHQEGFPDIYNGWARAGAYKQYSINATDEFSYGFKKRYLENRNSPSYNWQTDYSQMSADYMKDKQSDPFFQEAFNKSNANLQKWIQEKEFEFQSQELIGRAASNVGYQLRNIMDKVIDELDANYRSTIPIEKSGKDYAVNKQKYIQENLELKFDQEFDKIRNELNPALSKVDFDEILLTQTEAHIAQGGNYAPFFIKKITEPRPDGTPPIIDNPKFTKRATAILEKATEAVKVQQFAQLLQKKDTSAIDDESYKKYASNLFDNLVQQYRNNGLDQAQAIQQATNVLLPSLDGNRPIPQIKQILNRPIGTIVTNDNRAAFNLALMLDQVNALPFYFSGEENSRDHFKWKMATMLYRNGENINSVLLKMGRFEQANRIAVLDEKEKNALGTQFANLQSIYNQELVFDIAKYFKSINPNAKDDLSSLTKKYIDTYYFKDKGGKYISKSKLQAIGIQENQYEDFKTEAFNLVKKNLNVVDPIEGETGKQKFDRIKSLNETSRQKFNRELAEAKIRRGEIPDTSFVLDKYDFIINPDNKTAYFVKNDGTGYFQPVTIINEKKEEKLLIFNFDELKKNYLATEAKAKAIELKETIRKDEALQEFNRVYGNFSLTP